MRRDRKKPGSTDRAVRVFRSGRKGRAQDAASKKMAAIGRKAGNSGFDKQLKKAGSQRDRLIEFILERLQTVKGIQNKELLEIKNVRTWYKEVAKGHEGYTLPDPTRWHECAQQYRRAIEALCNGNMGQGVRLLENACELERAANETIPVQVRQKLNKPQRRQAEAPDTAAKVAATASCPTRNLPAGIRLAYDILSISDKMENAPPMQPLRNLQWWNFKDSEEDEDEDEEGDE